jgi:hypothetical protein
MRLLVRVTPFVTQMRRGRLHARFCRHARVDGPYRPSGRNASPSGITPSTIMSPTRSQPGSWTEIRPGARAHTTRTIERAHAPPPGPVIHHIEPPDPVACGGIPAQIRSLDITRHSSVRWPPHHLKR